MRNDNKLIVNGEFVRLQEETSGTWIRMEGPGKTTKNLKQRHFSHLLRIRPCGLFQFRITSEIMNHRHMVGLLGRVISSSQGLYLHRTTKHKQRRANIHALSGIRTRDPVYERSRPASQTARPLDRRKTLAEI
jgi:hypothetical protein